MLTLRGSACAVRPATLQDADDVAALSNAWSMNREGMAIHDAEELRVDWQVPGFCLESDTRVVHEASGRLVAYASVWDIGEPHVRVGSVLRVHPDHEESGLDETLLDWIELRAQWTIVQAPPEARVIVTNGAFSLDRRRKELLDRRGFKMLRHFWRLRIEMEGPPQVHNVPEEIDIRPYDPAADLEPTVIAVREAFRDHWGPRRSRSRSRSLIIGVTGSKKTLNSIRPSGSSRGPMRNWLGSLSVWHNGLSRRISRMSRPSASASRGVDEASPVPF